MERAGVPLVTLSLFGFRGWQRLWALAQMGLARRDLVRTGGLRFWKLVGSGKGQGFSLRPDWGRYGLLAVWEAPGAADAFLDGSKLMAAYRRHAYEAWTVRLRPARAHGAWSGRNPFLPLPPERGGAGPVAVLTRATLRPSRLVAFWRAVPSASGALQDAPGLIASIGIGEAPWVRQATFSLWSSEEEIAAWAYRHPAHVEAIRRTRAEGWYREELFARFTPVASEGRWNGRDPLAGWLPLRRG